MPRYIPSLDGLRAIAVLLVLWCHIPLTTPGYAIWLAEIRWWVRPGDFGVELFFALSGFLITRILLAERERNQPVRWFMLRRLLRIFPIYYLLLIVMAFTQPASQIAWCAFYLGNFADVFFPTRGPNPLGHTWSLCVEEHFYVLWPLVVACFAPKVGPRVLKWGLIPIAIGTAFTLCLTIDPKTAANAIEHLTPTRSLPLACGALLAYSEARRNASPRRLLALAIAMTAIGLMTHPNLWFVYIPFAWLQTSYWPLEYAPAFTRIHMAILCTGVVAWCVAPPGPMTLIHRILAFAPLRAIGRISYGLYLYHLPIFHKFIHSNPANQEDAGTNVMLAVIATFSVATASYWVIERPILKYAGRFRQRQSPPSLAMRDSH
ncbi:MAG: peptidoglycan/LPS O-acetylase OafA/YrhL [Planctomycetota bacterium]|jgi:peptidoglycan/LPS O-acetylase OafA/YrhL